MTNTSQPTTGEVVAGNIAEELSRRGWGYEQLADAADLSQSVLEPLRDDASKMTMNELAALALALAIPVPALARRETLIPDPSTFPAWREAHPAISSDDAPTYVTIKEAADALGLKPWPVVELVQRGEIRAVRYGLLSLVSAYDVEQLGGEL